MKGDALAQLEGVAAPIRRRLHALRQHGADGGILAEGDQTLEHIHHHRVGIGVAIDAGIGRTDIGIELDAQHFLRLGHGRRYGQ